MSRKIDNFIKRSNQSYIDRHGLRQIITCLSLIVILAVFWSLKLTGIGIAGEAFCGMDEHVHDERCQTGELICTLDEQTPHVHTEACLQQILQCPLEESEGHTHDDSCMDRALICTEEEREGHVHDETCSASTLICVEEAEDHTHSEDCYEIIQVCNLEEDPGHIHGDECYELSPLCGLEEVPGHTHDETCFGYAGGFGCGMTEAEGHTHNAQCVTESTVFACGEEAREGHAHGVECYDSQETCPLDEHIHVESCYSDITADIETGETWAAAIGELPLGVATRENVVMVARSQLGYTESALNFQVDLQGIRRGITRYGQWYGNPYGDWSAMFVSFCLHYAGADGLPANAGPEAMRLEWEQAGIYRSVDAYVPESGNVIFLDKDGDGRADHAAIISGVTDEGISLIAGDLGRTVTETFIALEDPTILGYGIVMDRNGPVFSTMASVNAISIATTASYNTNLFNDTSR